MLSTYRITPPHISPISNPRIIRMLNTLSLRLRLRSSYNPLVCHSVILSLPVHLLLCLTSPHPSHLSTCYSVLHHPTRPTCPPVTLSYITPLTPPVHLLLCLTSPHSPHLSTCYSVLNRPTHSSTLSFSYSVSICQYELF